MIEARTLAGMWTHYEAVVVPTATQDSVREAMRTAFYGGAGSLMHLLACNLVGSDAGKEQDAVLLDGIQGELECHAAALRGHVH